jgi:hypothetical protein
VREWFGVDDGRDVKRWSFDAMGQIFVLLTGCAAFDVFGDPRSRARPEVFSVYFPDSLISPGVSTEWSVMPRIHEFTFQSLIRGNDEAMSFDISPERGMWGVYSFNGEGVFPFFHESVVGVLDGGDGVF